MAARLALVEELMETLALMAATFATTILFLAALLFAGLLFATAFAVLLALATGWLRVRIVESDYRENN